MPQTEPMPPEPHRLTADVDATLMQQAFHVAQRRWDRTYIVTARQVIAELVLK